MLTRSTTETLFLALQKRAAIRADVSNATPTLRRIELSLLRE